jgi:hypothetical protein
MINTVDIIEAQLRCNVIFSLINEYTDLRYFWMANKNLWENEEKKKLCSFKLNCNMSTKYIDSIDFHSYI